MTSDTLTQIKVPRLEALFGGKWEKQLLRDGDGSILLDINLTMFLGGGVLPQQAQYCIY